MYQASMSVEHLAGHDNTTWSLEKFTIFRRRQTILVLPISLLQLWRFFNTTSFDVFSGAQQLDNASRGSSVVVTDMPFYSKSSRRNKDGKL